MSETVAVSAIDRHLADVRRSLPDRPGPEAIDNVIAGGGLVIDIRPSELRHSDGALPGALVVDRNQLEWRLDPTSDHRLAAVTDVDQVIVLGCDEGYASSLAAASLQALGLHRATDLDGGYQDWRSRQAAADPRA